MEIFEAIKGGELAKGKGVLVDVISPAGEYLDSFFFPLPKGVGLNGLGR